MKKVLLLILIFSNFFCFDVFALEYNVVNVTTNFSEEIEFSDIKKIKLSFYDEGIDYVDDASTIINIMELTQENNYSQIANNIKIVDESHLFAMVENDIYANYNCDISLNINPIDTANIIISVTKNNKIKNEQSLIPSDILEKVIGTTVAKPNSTSSSITNGTTNKNNHTNNSNNENKETTEVIEKQEEIQKQQKQKEKNNTITIALFIILGIIVSAVLLFSVYKIINANK